MKKALILILVFTVGLFAQVPGVVHILFDDGEVTTSGEDTFYEFNIYAYVTGTSNSDDLRFGSANIYVEYDTTLFSGFIAGTSNLEYSKAGLMNVELYPSIYAYRVTESVNTFYDVFGLTIEPTFPDYPDSYPQISNDPANPDTLFHVRMKAKAAGSGEVSFPNTRINDVDDQFWTVANVQYAGPQDFSEAVEPVYIEGPVGGEPYTSIELDYFEAYSKGDKVRLRWRTQSETENLGFIVKRAVVIDKDVYGIFEVIDSYQSNDDLLGAGTTSKKTDYMYWDKEVIPGTTYAYILQDVDEGGHIRECEPVIVMVKGSKVMSTDKFEFSSSYPNPFNPSFIVPFELYDATKVDIKLYDVSGRLVKEIANRDFNAGVHNLIVYGNDLSSGVYMLRIVADNMVSTQKMLMVK